MWVVFERERGLVDIWRHYPVMSGNSPGTDVPTSGGIARHGWLTLRQKDLELP